MTETEKVVPIRERPIGLLPGDPINHSVVDVLEKLLAAAQRGEIDGIALAISHPNGTVTTDWSSTPAGVAFRVAAAIMMLQPEYAGHIRGKRE